MAEGMSKRYSPTRKTRQRPAPMPMPANTTLPIQTLVEQAVAALAVRYKPHGQKKIEPLVRQWGDLRARHGLTSVPDDRLHDLAQTFVDRATRHGNPTESSRARRRGAVRTVLREAGRQGVLVKDPFSKTYDRVNAGQPLPIALKVQTYCPDGLPAAPWARVRPHFEEFVVAALAADATLSYGSVTNYLSRLLVWCDQKGIPVEVDRALDLNTVERHLRLRAELTGGSQSAARSTLLRVEQALRPRMHPRPMKRIKSLPSYSDEELEALIRWVRSLPASRVISELWAVLVFGLGAGLDVSAMRWLRGAQVRRINGVVVIMTPPSGSIR